MTSPHLSSTSDSAAPSPTGDRAQSSSRWLWLGGVGLLVLGGGFLAWQFFGQSQGGPPMMMPAAPVEIDPVATDTILDSSSFLGRLEAQTGVALQPEVAGRVVALEVAAGDRVEPGTVILRISPDRTQAELNAAQANVSAAAAARTSAAASLRSLRARRAELEAELTLETENYRRTVTLVEQGALSQQELDIASRDLEVAQATLKSAQEEIDAAQATLDQAAANLNQAQANRDAAAQSLQDRIVVAPIAGIVGDISVKLGDYVTPSTVITNITENGTLELDLDIPVDDRDRLRLGLPVQLVDRDAIGNVTFISPQVNTDTQTILVKARFNNTAGSLQDAQRVEARLVWDQQPGLVIETSAVTRLGNKTFVYIPVTPSVFDELNPPPAEGETAGTGDQTSRDCAQITPTQQQPNANGEYKALLCPVELGTIQDNRYEVASGLQAGTQVVTSGILNLQDGSLIQETSPPAANDGSMSPSEG